MALYDCFMYFDEDMLLDIRLNILNETVDKFVIAEATKTHSGKDKKLNFANIVWIVGEKNYDSLKHLDGRDLLVKSDKVIQPGSKKKLSNEGKTAALVVSPAIRRQFSAIVRQHVEEMIVLAFTELPDNRKINVVASIAG